MINAYKHLHVRTALLLSASGNKSTNQMGILEPTVLPRSTALRVQRNIQTFGGDPGAIGKSGDLGMRILPLKPFRDHGESFEKSIFGWRFP